MTASYYQLREVRVSVDGRDVGIIHPTDVTITPLPVQFDADVADGLRPFEAAAPILEPVSFSVTSQMTDKTARVLFGQKEHNPVTDFIDITNPTALQAHKDDWVCDEYDRLSEDVYDAYMDSLIAHISYVREAGLRLRVPDLLLQGHDQSKFSGREFYGYAMHFQGGGAPAAFARAWLHHIHHNPHHWQHWLFADGFTPKGSDVENGAVPMPGMYALEMVADWLGAGRTYTGSWDMTEWLEVNVPRIRVHSATAVYLARILNDLGYRVDPAAFGSALKQG